jgi:hypothetical protein
MTYANVNACCELSVVSDHVRLAALEQHKGIRQGNRVQSIEIKRGAFNQEDLTIG